MYNMKTFRLNSMPEAVFLRTMGYELVESVKEGNKIVFVFKYDPKMEHMIDDYYAGALVPAVEHWNNMKNFKSIVNGKLNR